MQSKEMHDLDRLQHIMDVGDVDLRRKYDGVNKEDVLDARWEFARLLGVEQDVLAEISKRDGLPRPSNLHSNYQALRDAGIEEPSDVYNRDRKTVTLSGEKIAAVTGFLGRIATDHQIKETILGKPSLLTYSQERVARRIATLVKRGYSFEEIASSPQLFAKGKLPKKLNRF